MAQKFDVFREHHLLCLRAFMVVFFANHNDNQTNVSFTEIEITSGEMCKTN